MTEDINIARDGDIQFPRPKQKIPRLLGKIPKSQADPQIPNFFWGGDPSDSVGYDYITWC